MGAKAILRPMREDDLPLTRRWRNDPEIRAFMFSQHTISVAEHRAWYERATKSPREHLFIMERGGEGSAFLRLHVQDEASSRAEWGFYTSPEAPRGTGTILGRLGVGQAFGALGLHKLYGEVIETNLASVALHMKLGFTKEAQLRDHFYHAGRYQKVYGFGLLAAEWTLNGMGCHERK